MNTKIFEYLNNFKVIVYDSELKDENGNEVIWFEGTWGNDGIMTPAQIKKEAELLAEDAKKRATEIPKEILIK